MPPLKANHGSEAVMEMQFASRLTEIENMKVEPECKRETSEDVLRLVQDIVNAIFQDSGGIPTVLDRAHRGLMWDAHLWPL